MRDRGDVLGNALLAGDGTDYYAYAFQDHIGILEQKLGFAVLGYVLTHEVGHLLLGSNSHAVNGIMSPHWNGAELRRISEGPLLFLPSESRILRSG
jgi:predicted membrane protein